MSDKLQFVARDDKLKKLIGHQIDPLLFVRLRAAQWKCPHAREHEDIQPEGLGWHLCGDAS